MTVIARRQANCANARLNTDEQHTGLDELIRKLVSHVAGARDSVIPANPEFSREEIVVDTSVDGVRYLMVRMPSCNSALISLSPREQQISRMVARGYPNKTIAGVLNISAWTVCTHIRRIFAKLGVADQVAGKSRKVRGPPSGEPVAAVVARGEAEIGFQQVAELIHVPGVTFVGTIPAELQPGFSFAGALTTEVKQPEAASALIRFLASPEAAPVILKAGLTPLSPR
jgi:DNA-binding CsgD family transcriptional regulator